MPLLALLLMSCLLFSVTAGGQSLLQQHIGDLSQLFEEEEFESIHLVERRFTLPEHFVAESVSDQIYNSERPNELTFGDETAVFLLLNSGDRTLELLLDRAALGTEGRLYIHNADVGSTEEIGPGPGLVFSSKKPGSLIVEWNEARDSEVEFDFQGLLRNVYLHRPVSVRSTTGFGTSLDCHINVHCPEGQAFLEVKDGVCRVRVVVEEGIGFCSGALINNTARDYTPYILTAFHCMDGFTPLYDMWRFDFFYEGNSCSNPTEEPEFVSLTGSEFRAGHPDSDFLLLEITSDLPPDLELPFLGWDRREDFLPQNTALIHHPSGDIKKVSRYSGFLRVHSNRINWNNGTSTPALSHYRQNLTAGTFEPGSSGCPILSPEGRIMGQLHGGNSSCSIFLAYSGIFYYSWDVGDNPSERLRDWLDPLNTGQDTLNHLLRESELFSVNISGTIATPPGTPVGQVEVVLSCDGISETVVTGEDGSFQFNLELFEENTCLLDFSKDLNHLNGINVLDLVGIRRHILNIQALDDFQFLAADVNGDGVVNVIDMVEIRRLILQINDRFPGVNSWMFLPDTVGIEIDSPENHILDVTGIKMGDVDFTADPAQ